MILCKNCNTEMQGHGVPNTIIIYWCKKCGTIGIKKYPFMVNDMDKWFYPESIGGENAGQKEAESSDGKAVE